MNEILNKIVDKINKEEEISPFLFVSKNTEILNQEIQNLSIKILNKYNIPNIYVYKLKDDWEKLKVNTVKEFIKNSQTKSPYKIQIFLIENISRLTTQASNSLLKFFEEPWVWNLILCTNNWESNILDTIISRLQIIDLWWKKIKVEDDFLQNIIWKYIKSESNELIKYLFGSDIDKKEYLSFLENLFLYFYKNKLFIYFLEELNKDINLVKTNNLNPKYFSDKWILKIK